MSKREIAIGGIWIHRQFPHLGDELEVRVEVDGKWRTIGKWNADDYISHIVEPPGIDHAPFMEDE